MHLADAHRTQIPKYRRGDVKPQAGALEISVGEFFTGVGWQDSAPRLIAGESAEGLNPESFCRAVFQGLGPGVHSGLGASACGPSCVGHRLSSVFA